MDSSECNLFTLRCWSNSYFIFRDFYKAHHNEYIMPENIIREGLYCVQVIYGEYHRGLVVDLLPEVEGMIKVKYIILN